MFSGCVYTAQGNLMCDKVEGFGQGNEYYAEVPQEPRVQYVEGFVTPQREFARSRANLRAAEKEYKDAIRQQERERALKRIAERESR